MKPFGSFVLLTFSKAIVSDTKLRHGNYAYNRVVKLFNMKLRHKLNIHTYLHLIIFINYIFVSGRLI